jgi:ABC-2 type transport system ATP-binding protein
MTDELVIETERLGKSYGRLEAVKELNLSIRPGCITAFLGLNGAGKSTTIKMLLGMIRPSSGNGTILGQRISDPIESVRLRKQLAYVSENKRLYDYMTVDQMIRFTRAFYPDWRADEEQKLLRQYRLPLDRKVKSLSKGMRTKLGLLMAFARRPELLILDEPSEGLDPVGIEELLEILVTRCSEGTTVFFSSHQIAEVERIADRISVLHAGRLVLDSSLDDLRQSYRRINLVFPSIPAEHHFRIPGVENVRTRGHQMSVLASSNAEGVVARAHDFHADSIDVAPVELRDIFLEKVKENLTDALV